MEDWQKLLVTKNLPKLIHVTTCNIALIALLRKAGILSEADQQDVMHAQKLPLERSYKLYEILVTRKGSYDVLMQALKETNQGGALAYLSRQSSNYTYYGVISYDKTDIIGKGCNNTVVYRGTFDSRRAAIKVVKLASQDQEEDEYSLNEIEFLKQLDQNENVIRYYFAEQKDHSIFIAMELCRTNLQEWMKDKCVEMNVEDICHQALMGLAHIHKNHIIHRDLKPTNILISDQRVIKMADFGLSKQIPIDASSVSIHTGMAGTEGWVAPEVLQIVYYGANLKLTTATDIFSLGCVFYYVMTDGLHPFGEPIERQVNIKNNASQIEIAAGRVSSIHLGLIKKMIADSPKARPTAEEILKTNCFKSIRGNSVENGFGHLLEEPEEDGQNYESSIHGNADTMESGEEKICELVESSVVEKFVEMDVNQDYIPKTNHHYINRLLSYRRRLNPEVF